MFCSRWDCQWNEPSPLFGFRWASKLPRRKSIARWVRSRAFLSDSPKQRKKTARMPLRKQLEFVFERRVLHQRAGRDVDLELRAREILSAVGARRLAYVVRVEWNPRLLTAAGRADFRQKLISLNPRLCDYGEAEIDRTLRHELAHLLAQFRAGRRRILPHGDEWRTACRDLEIADEKRCHNLPFPVTERAWRYRYKCPHCQRDFHRTRRIKRAVACLACCRAHNGGQFAARFRPRLVSTR